MKRLNTDISAFYKEPARELNELLKEMFEMGFATKRIKIAKNRALNKKEIKAINDALKPVEIAQRIFDLKKISEDPSFYKYEDDMYLVFANSHYIEERIKMLSN